MGGCMGGWGSWGCPWGGPWNFPCVTKEALEHEWLHMDPLKDPPGDAAPLPTISEGLSQVERDCWDIQVIS